MKLTTYHYLNAEVWNIWTVISMVWHSGMFLFFSSCLFIFSVQEADSLDNESIEINRLGDYGIKWVSDSYREVVPMDKNIKLPG
jgi:hypothetical protein